MYGYIVTYGAVAAEGEVIVKEEPDSDTDIPRSPSNNQDIHDHNDPHNHARGGACPCREEIQSLKLTVQQLSSALEKQEEKFLQFKATVEAHLAKGNYQAIMNDKATQYVPQTSGNTITVVATESMEIKEEPRVYFMGRAVTIEEVQDCKQEEGPLPIPRWGMNTKPLQSLGIRQPDKTIDYSNNEKDTPSQCEKCTKVFKNKTCLLRHVKRHMVPPVVCNLCSKTLKNKNNLAKHFLKVHKGRHCQLCSAVFTDIIKFNVHMKLHTEAKIPMPALPSRHRQI